MPAYAATDMFATLMCLPILLNRLILINDIRRHERLSFHLNILILYSKVLCVASTSGNQPMGHNIMLWYMLSPLCAVPDFQA